MSPFEDFDIDLLKIQNIEGAAPLDVDTSGSSNQTCSTYTMSTPIWEQITGMLSKGTTKCNCN